MGGGSTVRFFHRRHFHNRALKPHPKAYLGRVRAFISGYFVEPSIKKHIPSSSAQQRGHQIVGQLVEYYNSGMNIISFIKKKKKNIV
jgi:hypothetical protein